MAIKLPPLRAMAILEILEPDAAIAQRIGEALQQDLNKLFQKRIPDMINEIRRFLPMWIMGCDEIQSLLGGDLQADFGIPSPTASVNRIVNAVASSLQVSFKPVPKRITGKILEISIQPSSMTNILGLNEHIITEKGERLDWLHWLVERGDDIVIFGYGVEYGSFGRTNMAHMVKAGSFFRVNPAYSGTTEDNFITRALDSKKDAMSNIIMRHLAR